MGDDQLSIGRVERVVIIAGGNIEDYSWYDNFWKEDDYIICADSGADHARSLGVIPDLIVGDLDSAQPENVTFFQRVGSKVLDYPREKDQTDTQIALEYALEKEPAEIAIIGALGSRLDHTLSNILLLTSLVDRGIQATILNEVQEIFVVKDEINLEGKKGDIISLLPLTPLVKGIKSHGLRYVVKDEVFEQSNPYGVSNELMGQEASIQIGEGLLLLIKIREL